MTWLFEASRSTFGGRNPWKLAGFFRFKQVKLTGAVEATAQLADASDDLGTALRGAKVILISHPALTHRDIAERCAPFLEDGQIILLCAIGLLGSVEFAKTLKEIGMNKDITCADYRDIPVGGKFIESGVINAPVPYSIKPMGIQRRSFGIFPARRTEEVMEVLSHLYPGIPCAENVLACSLIGGGPDIRQAVGMLMNATIIENFVYTDLGKEGFTPSVAKVHKALDNERQAIHKVWGFESTESFTPGQLSGKESIRDLREEPSGSPYGAHYVMWARRDRLDMKHRYVSETIPYAFVPRCSLAAKVGVRVPVHEALVHIFSAINGIDYFNTGRSLNSLGLGNMNIEQINGFVYSGYGEG